MERGGAAQRGRNTKGGQAERGDEWYLLNTPHMRDPQTGERNTESRAAEREGGGGAESTEIQEMTPRECRQVATQANMHINMGSLRCQEEALHLKHGVVKRADVPGGAGEAKN